MKHTAECIQSLKIVLISTSWHRSKYTYRSVSFLWLLKRRRINIIFLFLCSYIFIHKYIFTKEKSPEALNKILKKKLRNIILSMINNKNVIIILIGGYIWSIGFEDVLNEQFSFLGWLLICILSIF